MSTGTFHHGQPGAAAGRRAAFQPSAAAAYHDSTELARHFGAAVPAAVFHREPGPGMVHTDIAEFLRQLGPVDVVLVDPQLPDRVMPVHDSYYSRSVLQHGPRAGRGVVLVALLPGGSGSGSGGAVYNGGYALQPRPGAGRGVVRAALLPGGGGGAVYTGGYALQPRPGAGHGEVLADLLPDGAGVTYNNYLWQPSSAAGHGEEFVGLLLGDVDAVYDDYGYYAWQSRRGAGRGEVFIGPLPDGVGAVFDSSGNFAQQTIPATGRADGIGGPLRDPNLGGGLHGNRGMVTEHLRRLFGFVGIGASAVAMNGLAAGPGSPAVAFHLFVLLLGGLFLVILHVLRV